MLVCVSEKNAQYVCCCVCCLCLCFVHIVCLLKDYNTTSTYNTPADADEISLIFFMFVVFLLLTRLLRLSCRSMGILLPPVSQVTNTRINHTQHHRNRSLDSALQRIPEVSNSYSFARVFCQCKSPPTTHRSLSLPRTPRCALFRGKPNPTQSGNLAFVRGAPELGKFSVILHTQHMPVRVCVCVHSI